MWKCYFLGKGRSVIEFGIFIIEQNFFCCVKEFKQFFYEVKKIVKKLEYCFILWQKIEIFWFFFVNYFVCDFDELELK